ncbi:MAG TPA: alpha/beta fold hydrolase [Solirubrobacteraceae bacterium]|jgi:pimeloyl-ACP methyl ester carboxylesterase|nr:alpha/beta fold hydrolase [Solirubrobacteraceae bacterium]
MADFLLIHGAMGGAWCWERVIPGLEATGHRASAIDLPGQGADTTPLSEITLYRYADAVCDALDGMDGPVVLTGHSMGGMVITQAASQRPDKLAGLVYVAAFLPQSGQSLIEITHLPEAAGDSVQANIVVDGDPPVATMPPEAAPEALYHCCTQEQIDWALPQRAGQPVIPFTQPFTPPGGAGAGFDALPRAYVTCLQDRAIKPALQRLMYSAAGCDPVIEIDTDHSPWLSRTEELVAALDRIGAALAAR